MSTGTLAPCPWVVLDDDGIAVPGALLYSYLAGTTTPSPIYRDGDLEDPYDFPAEADAGGYIAFYLDALSYRIVVKRANGDLIRSLDPIQGVQAGTTNLGEVFTFGGDPNATVLLTSYPTGTTFDKCHAGTRWFNLDTAELPAGTYKLEGMLQGTGGTITAAIVNLSDGSPDTALATISSASATGDRQVSGAITFAGPGAAKNYAIKTKVSAGYGQAWGLALRRTA